MKTGTSYFISFNTAMKYYRPYEDGNIIDVIRAKIEAGEIHIGKPPVKSGERAYLNQEEGRYFVETQNNCLTSK